MKISQKNGVSAGNSDLFRYLEEWVRSARDQKQPVVLDLRNNGGGNPSNALQVVSYFLPENQKATPGVQALAGSASNRDSMIDFLLKPATEQVKGYETGFHQAFREQYEREAGTEEGVFSTPFFRAKSIESKKILKGPLPLLVLTGPECISACEILVMTLAKNKLARIVGSPTAGTGMGMWTRDSEQNVQSLDLRYRTSQLPNRYFGAPDLGADGSTGLIRSQMKLEDRIRLISENRPLGVDVPYAETLEDLLQNGKGWLEFAARIDSLEEFKRQKLD
jgi:hypothetical protein